MSSVREYFRGLFAIARRSSWTGANGLAGTAIVGVAFIRPGVQTFLSAAYRWATPLNWLFSFIIFAIIAWIILFLFQLIFVAPYQLWKRERDERARVETEAATESPRDRQIVDHDKKLATRMRELFPENSKVNLTSDLLNQHAYWDRESKRLVDLLVFLDSAEAHFLVEELRTRARAVVATGSEMMNFMAYKFFIYPREQRESPMYFAMQPNLNVDREGSGTPEQDKKYDVLTEQLDALVAKFSEAYDELIKAFHRELLE